MFLKKCFRGHTHFLYLCQSFVQWKIYLIRLLSLLLDVLYYMHILFFRTLTCYLQDRWMLLTMGQLTSAPAGRPARQVQNSYLIISQLLYTIVIQVLVDYAVCDRRHYCKALCDVMFSQIVRNCPKISSHRAKQQRHQLNFLTVSMSVILVL